MPSILIPRQVNWYCWTFSIYSWRPELGMACLSNPKFRFLSIWHPRGWLTWLTMIDQRVYVLNILMAYGHIIGKRLCNGHGRRCPLPPNDGYGAGTFCHYISDMLLIGNSHPRQRQTYARSVYKETVCKKVDQSRAASMPLQSYLKTLPRTKRRMVLDVTQVADDVQIWRAFRSKENCTSLLTGACMEIKGPSDGFWVRPSICCTSAGAQ